MLALSGSIPDFIQDPKQIKLFQKLLDQRKDLVPFIGAGLSVPLCPSWAGFIDDFYKAVQQDLLDDKERQEFAALKQANDYEGMVDLLFKATEGLIRENLLKEVFLLKPDAPMARKLALLHAAFPGLMITTNIDNLIFQTAPGGIHLYHGKQEEDLHRALVKGQRALLAIHGDLANMNSLVFSKQEYDQIYGAEESFDPKAALPGFLAQVFDHHRLLFIGCSLDRDRVLDVLAARPDKRTHYAILHQGLNTLVFRRRLSTLYIEPLWITDYAQIETILACLAGSVADRPWISPPSVFVGRQKELAALKEGLAAGKTSVITGRLFNLEGAGGIGKTTLAREAAAQMAESFQDGLFEFAMQRFNPMTFAVELGKRLGYQVDEPADRARATALITQLLQDRKTLLLLDNLVQRDDLPYMIPNDNHTAVIVTTRDRDCFHYLAIHRRDLKTKMEQIKLERFTPDEALELCRELLGSRFVATDQELYQKIAQRLAYLPVALRPAYQLMVFKPHYPAAELLSRLNGPEILALLAKARDEDLGLVQSVFALDSEWLDQEDHRNLLTHMAWCAAGPIPLDFLARFYGLEDMHETLDDLITRSWCTQNQGPEGLNCELHILVRETVRSQTDLNLDDKLIGLIDVAYCGEHFAVKDRWLAQFQEALTLCRETHDPRQVDWIYGWFRDYCEQRGHNSLFISLADQVMALFPEDNILAVGSSHKSNCLKALGRLQEAYELNQSAIDKLTKLKDKAGLAAVYGNQALILRAWGRLEEAMALFQKQQALNEELGNRAGLASCYGNQALILSDWGRLEEAMALHQKEQALKEELGNRAGLAGCYGNQAVILRAWGRLEEAMALHQKVQVLFEELGNRAGLASCYGNQALILIDWGKLEEAMALFQKEQALKEELGNRAGLASCYGNQAVIFIHWGRLEEAMALFQKEQALEEELGNRAGLASCYGNQALILSDWGRLEEAMALHQKQQALEEELGNRVGLASCYGNQAVILIHWGRLEEAMALFQKEQALKEELGNRAGLATCYGNQALILRAWGRLEQAMALHQKEQALEEELGNRAGLASCYGNQALILRAWGRLEEAMALHQKEQALKEELGNRAGLAICYGNQALILSDWGRLEEAMALHQKEQALNEELGNRAGLAICLWNQGSLLDQMGDPVKAAESLRRAIQIRKEIGIPVEQQEKQLANWEARNSR